MTGFGSLYYTDCRAGQGLLGGAGFQFQAASPGLPPEAMEVARRGVLYEPPAAWMRERRPVAAYPPSLAHVVEGGCYVTGAGRYLGAEADGSREGNQFTHAVVTRDPDDYGLTRPAQLWGARWWARGPAAGTALPGVAAPVPPGPWDPESVRDRLRAAPDVDARLVALLSALHHLRGSEPGRVLLVSSDAEEAVVWLAAATLLLPRRNALRVTFRAFAANPLYSPHDVLVVHPDWADGVRDAPGFRCVDLDAGTVPDVPPVPAARFWVPRFLERDPFDVVDAVEVAGRSDPDDEGARLAAAAVTLGERAGTRRDATLLADWLATAPAELADAAGDAVVAAVLDGARDAGALRRLDGAVHSGRVPGGGVPDGARGDVAPAVRSALAAAELDELRSGRTAARTRLPAVPDAPDVPSPTSLLTDALEHDPPERLSAVLRLVTRFAARPPADVVLRAAVRTAVWWADHPGEATVEPDAWPASVAVLALLRDELADRLRSDAAGAGAVVQAVDRHWWPRLWPAVTDPDGPLDALVCAAGRRHADADTRRAVRRTLAVRPEPDADLLAWRAVVGPGPPSSTDVAEHLRDLCDAGVAPGAALAAELWAVLAERPVSEPAATAALRRLDDAGHPPPGTFPELVRRVDDDRALRALVEVVRTTTTETASTAVTQLDRLPGAPAAAGEIIAALLQAGPTTGAAVVARTRSAVRRALVDELQRRCAADAPDRAVALAFLLLVGNPHLDQSEAARLREHLAPVVRGMAKPERGAVQRLVGEAFRQSWWKWLRDVDTQRDRGGEPPAPGVPDTGWPRWARFGRRG